MKPKYKIGEIVKVYEYYAEGDIIKDVYYGLIVDRTTYDFGTSVHTIYDVLPNDKSRPAVIESAEEFALESLEI